MGKIGLMGALEVRPAVVCGVAALLLAFALPWNASAESPFGDAPVVPAPPPPVIAPAAPVAPFVPAAPAPMDAVAPKAVATVGKLPPGMAVRVDGGALQLLRTGLPEGRSVVVAGLALPRGKYLTLYVDGYLYIARGDADIVMYDVHDLMHPRIERVFPAGGEVVGLWGGSGTVIVQRDTGSTMQIDTSDPAHPRLEGYVPAQVAVEVARRESLKSKSAGQSRFTAYVRPFMFVANNSRVPTSDGAAVGLAYQYAALGGLWWGIELAPLQFNSYYNGSPWVDSRAFFGYSATKWAIAAAFGSGYTVDTAFFQLGAGFRFGRLDRVHSYLRLMWSVLLPLAYPANAEFSLEVPLSARFGLRYAFDGDSALGGFHTTLNLQTYLGGDRRMNTTVLSTGVGFAFMQTSLSQSSFSGAPNISVNHPGVVFNLALEPRW